MRMQRLADFLQEAEAVLSRRDFIEGTESETPTTDTAESVVSHGEPPHSQEPDAAPCAGCRVAPEASDVSLSPQAVVPSSALDVAEGHAAGFTPGVGAEDNDWILIPHWGCKDV